MLHPGQSATVLIEERYVGRFGRLHPEVENALDLDVPVFAFEFDAEALLVERERRHGGVARYPHVRRDLAVVVIGR